jgi:hypothetical protein
VRNGGRSGLLWRTKVIFSDVEVVLHLLLRQALYPSPLHTRHGGSAGLLWYLRWYKVPVVDCGRLWVSVVCCGVVVLHLLLRQALYQSPLHTRHGGSASLLWYLRWYKVPEVVQGTCGGLWETVVVCGVLRSGCTAPAPTAGPVSITTPHQTWW